MKLAIVRSSYLQIGMIVLGVCVVIWVAAGLSTRTSQVHTLYASPVMGIVLDDTMRVIHVEPESAAAQAGILRDDTLVKVNNVELVDDAIKTARESILQAAINKQPSTLIIQRGDSLITLDIKPDHSNLQSRPLTPTPVLPPYTYL